MTDINERVETLRRLIRIRSVQGAAEPGKPYGPGPAAALAEALKIADEMGFKTVNMDNHCGYAEYGSGDEMVMVLGHLDVVPEGEGWSVPPYEGVVKDGKMYGRGTADDKGPVIEALFALRDIKESGTALRRRIRIVFGVNEETGCEDMAYYKKNGGEIPVMGITPDACYPLINGEKGILVEDYSRSLRQSGGMRLLSIHGGTAFNVTPSSAEAWISAPEGTVFPEAPRISVRYVKDMKDSPEVPAGATVCIRAEGKSAHGSTPEKGINANGLLVNYLAKLPFEGEAKDALTFLSEKIGMTYHGEGFGVDLHDDVSGWLVNNWGVLDGDAGHISVTLNYRYPVTFHKEYCQPKVQTVFEKAGWRGKTLMEEPALYVPEDSPFVQMLLSVYREETGDMSAPMCIGGGTYAKSIPNCLAFGSMFPGDPEVEHLPDEYLPLDRFGLNEKILQKAMLAMANA